ncbi:hypothetical protein D3C74_335160 [compost metagenome]
MVDDQIHDDLDPAFMRLVQKLAEIVQCTIVRVNLPIVGHIIAVVTWRRVNRHQPNPADTQIGVGIWVSVVQVVELAGQAFEISDAVAVRIGEGTDEDFIEYRRRLGIYGIGCNSFRTPVRVMA